MQWPPLRSMSDAPEPTTRDKDSVSAPPVPTTCDDDAKAARGYLPLVELAAPVLDASCQADASSQMDAAIIKDSEPDASTSKESERDSATNPVVDRASSPTSSSADSGINHTDADPYYWEVAAADDENIDAKYCYDTHAPASTPAPHAARAAVPNDDPYAWPPRAYNFNAVWPAAVAAKAAPVPAPSPAPVAAAADAREETAVVVDVRDETIAARAAVSVAEAVDDDAAVADAFDLWKLVCQHYAVASARPSTATAAACVR
ncbi:hypothetical protein AMAG_16163 [Allomyces macrogynus ATCC 38327]|uniref:Uncharacterized protein n=1 Tax=Allomyces macrogynus (strain ATCC 38327) TaxID=578462 RepID=A0A0L0TA51_ALLM3|nr:hypothetical protein AMAG_16163 [Allomyces macrogynus ATCC 38327]|eukprot:KNE71601.1 hypothetical protein AMAG_16163 [Allomyces macrogynus ATCC 38327]